MMTWDLTNEFLGFLNLILSRACLISVTEQNINTDSCHVGDEGVFGVR